MAGKKVRSADEVEASSIQIADLLAQALQPSFSLMAKTLMTTSSSIYRGVNEFAKNRGITIEEALEEMDAMAAVVAAQERLAELKARHDKQADTPDA